IYDSDLVVMWLGRLFQSGKFDKRKIIPSETIKVVSDKDLTLVAILLYPHPQQHYNVVFKCGREWYFYDDSAPKITLYAENYAKLLTERHGYVVSHAVGFIYLLPDYLSLNE